MVRFIVLLVCYDPLTNPKEVTSMKSVNVIRRPNYAAYRRRAAARPIYPNAASARYHLSRLLDGALAGATVLGLVASVLFSLTLWG